MLSTSTLGLAPDAAAMPFGSGVEAGIPVVDIIPRSQSGETGQNSEPSIAVNPNAPHEAVIGVFSDTPLSPYYSTQDGGSTWVQFDAQRSFDSTLSWSASGTLYLGRTSDVQVDKNGFDTQSTIEVDKVASPVTLGKRFTPIPGSVYTSPLGAQVPDRPQVVAAQVCGEDHIYLSYNNFDPFSNLNQLLPPGNSATVRFSTDGGGTWNNTLVDRGNSGGFADDPAVQTAVNGNRVYVAFERGTTRPDFDHGIATGQVVVVRDDNAGNNDFNDLGANGTTVANISAPISNPLGGGGQSLGQERIGGDLTLAVDPRNADHLYVGYADIDPSSGEIRVHVQESTNGGRTWTERFKTQASPNFKAALPYLAVADNGVVGLLYTAQSIDYQGVSFLETHFVQTGNDFGRSTDTLLSRFKDGVLPIESEPYIGDYEGLKAVGNTFYGTFSASNQADGTNAIFPGGVTFQRGFTGTPGHGDFQLKGGTRFSIDPYYFQVDAQRNRTSNDFATSADTVLPVSDGVTPAAAPIVAMAQADAPARSASNQLASIASPTDVDVAPKMSLDPDGTPRLKGLKP